MTWDAVNDAFRVLNSVTAVVIFVYCAVRSLMPSSREKFIRKYLYFIVGLPQTGFLYVSMAGLIVDAKPTGAALYICFVNICMIPAFLGLRNSFKDLRTINVRL